MSTFKQELGEWWADARPGSKSCHRGEARWVIVFALPLALLAMRLLWLMLR